MEARDWQSPYRVIEADATRARHRTGPVSIRQFDDHSRAVPFPCALGASEPMCDYRYALGVAMRRWVLATLSDYADYPTVSETDAVTVCEKYGRLAVGKTLHANERRLIAEAVRDVIVAREVWYQREEWLSEMQTSHVGSHVGEAV